MFINKNFLNFIIFVSVPKCHYNFLKIDPNFEKTLLDGYKI